MNQDNRGAAPPRGRLGRLRALLSPQKLLRYVKRLICLPWNFQLDPTGRFLFIINMRALRVIPPGRGNTLHSFAIGPDGRLKELGTSPIQIPVPLDTNPWGMAIVPHSR